VLVDRPHAAVCGEGGGPLNKMACGAPEEWCARCCAQKGRRSIRTALSRFSESSVVARVPPLCHFVGAVFVLFCSRQNTHTPENNPDRSKSRRKKHLHAPDKNSTTFPVARKFAQCLLSGGGCAARA
jgi:hypothetical protein